MFKWFCQSVFLKNVILAYFSAYFLLLCVHFWSLHHFSPFSWCLAPWTMHLYDSVLLRSAQLLKWPNHWKTKCLLWVKLWSPLPVVLQISTGKIQSFQLRLFGNFVCRQKISLHTVHIWFSWSCLFTSLTLRKLLMLHTLLTIDNEPFSPLNFISVTTPFHFGRFVTSHCGGLFPGETMRDYSSQQLFASGLCLCFLGHWAARAV